MVVELQVKSREKTQKPRALRRAGIVPATLYGPEIEAMDLQLSAKDFSRVAFEEYSHLINLKDEKGTEHEALIKDVQRDMISREVLNIQFYKVKRGHKLNLKVNIKFKGVSEAVKMGCDLVTVHKEAHVRCFPRHIPSFIEVDISKLVNTDDSITFDDLDINREELEILDPGQEVICKAEAKKADHTLEPVTPAATAEAGSTATAEAAPAAGAKAPAAAKAPAKK